ncbi:ABC transporter ATP-binding protein [Allostreptomyces psammosilenae]|uniref:ABC-type polysaccharide/polyol phosphate transport system ATPase subunit n=1 Tax=Allostreptomyces psammosilenae TaxID=1892865 RepID=A0A853A1X4_9ACTN|nr:ABC transporter ATP-binding protein [Allostreptomyces psammosilenae]NYI07460.1 ABC-type polysaccharide/polyol phosphate transport system ATPase subunit [Allostreptomyces psammosilenae]
MSPEPAPAGTIRAEHVWKRFRPDHGRLLLRDRIERAGRRLRDRATAPTARATGGGRGGDGEWSWALRDIDLHIRPGESVGLIGSNGSGKSTLLKLLTRVMYPYAGRIDVAGRIGALIEIRAGIHPDLTGRENIYLFGALLGLRRREVAARFDDIVEFAQLAGAIDRQVKFYSSGMQMRLGFAVAAYLEPDVLLVDEVLAVGDAVFQHKCLDRMRQVLEQGTTLVFVSHDLAAVESVCGRGVWLDRGTVRVDGTMQQALAAYRGSIEAGTGQQPAQRADEPVRLLKCAVRGAEREQIASGGPAVVEIEIGGDTTGPVVLHLGVSEGTANLVFSFNHEILLDGGDAGHRCTLPHLPLPRGRYTLWLGAHSSWDPDGQALMSWHAATSFDVHGPELDAPPRAVVRAAPVFVPHSWERL